MSIYIQQGGESFTGAWLPKVWTVYTQQLKPQKFNKLADAKRFAIERGASGKWKREVRKSGPRGAALAMYRDCGEKQEQYP